MGADTIFGDNNMKLDIALAINVLRAKLTPIPEGQKRSRVCARPKPAAEYRTISQRGKS